MLRDKNNNQGLVDGSALVPCSVPANRSNGEQWKRLWCDHCNCTGHTRDTCWKIHGKPANWTPRRQPEGRGFQAQTSTSDPNINFNKSEGFESATIRLNKEQIEQLYKLLNQSSLTRTNGNSNIGSCSVAQKGTLLTALNAIRTKGMVWIVDSRALDHMTGTTKVFSSYIPCDEGQKIKKVDGTLSPVAGKGTVSFSDSLELNYVLYVPNLSCNLLSVRKLTKDLNCTAKFFPSCCEFQDLSSGRTIGKARECDGLYYYEDSAMENGQANAASSELDFFSSNDEIMSGHFRLGHPNFLYLKSLFPALFGNKNVSDFQCEIAKLQKAIKIPTHHDFIKPHNLFP